MKIGGKEINDECQYCGEVLQCELFRQGHGIRENRKNVAVMVQCQFNKRERQRKGERE